MEPEAVFAEEGEVFGLGEAAWEAAGDGVEGLHLRLVEEFGELLGGFSRGAEAGHIEGGGEGEGGEGEVGIGFFGGEAGVEFAGEGVGGGGDGADVAFGDGGMAGQGEEEQKGWNPSVHRRLREKWGEECVGRQGGTACFAGRRALASMM